MARAGRVVASTLELMESSAREGVTTGELDALAEEYIRSCGGVPTFKGYRGFPGSICASPNEMIVHGIPGPYRLKQGDLLSVDVGVTLDGFVADSAITIPIGTVSEQAYELIAVCQKSLDAAIAQCRPGNRLGDISHAVQEVVEANGFGVVRALVGHGVGRSMHEDPQIPNYGPAGRGPKLASGHGVRDRADDHRRQLGRGQRRRRLGRLHRRRQPGRAHRAHGGRDRGRPAGADTAVNRAASCDGMIGFSFARRGECVCPRPFLPRGGARPQGVLS